jgi:hypothetical protein
MKGVLKMKGQHFFYVGLGVLLLALLVACGQVPIAEPEPGQPAPAEVVAAQTEEESLTIQTEAATGSAYYAANPELMLALRHAELEREITTNSAYFAVNPELMVAQGYPAVIKDEVAASPSLYWTPIQRGSSPTVSPEVRQIAETRLLAANPELMVARRNTVIEEVSQPEAYDIEMLRIQRYAEVADKRAEAAFLAANPELMVARRYAVVESGVDPDRDIGLLEFFTGPNETNRQRAIERKIDPD